MNSNFDDCKCKEEVTPSQKLMDELWAHLEPLLKSEQQSLDKYKHLEYLQAALDKEYGPEYSGYDVIRPWLCFWTLHSLEILNSPIEQDVFITTIASYQNPSGGFGGKPGIMSHLACTYASLATLCILDVPSAYQIVNRVALREFIMRMKRVDGSFHLYERGEHDVRGIYCAVVSAYLCGILDCELAQGCMERIWACQTWEGGFGSHPKCEAHGGYTFCAVAALDILSLIYPNAWEGIDIGMLVKYCQSLQCKRSGGFAGRTGKLVDGCYSFWLAGTLEIIGQHINAEYDKAALERFILNVCQEERGGGLRDKPGKKADLYHTCYCLSGLALVCSDLQFDLDPIINVERGKAQRMREYFLKLK